MLIVVPEVVRELGDHSEEVALLRRLPNARFPEEDTATHPALLACNGMHAGELAVLSFALDFGIDTVLVDDSAARACAKRVDLRIAGFLGVLQAAKMEGLLPAVRPLADAAIAAGYRIRPSVYAAFLRRIGEA